jgi:hypothetical protein
MNNENIVNEAAVIAKNTKKSSYENVACFFAILSVLLAALVGFGGHLTVEVLKEVSTEVSTLEQRAASAEARVAELEKPKSFSEKLKALVQN